MKDGYLEGKMTGHCTHLALMPSTSGGVILPKFVPECVTLLCKNYANREDFGCGRRPRYKTPK